MSWPPLIPIGQDFIYFPDDRMAVTLMTDIEDMKIDVGPHYPDNQKNF
jgi:hypothetical protein